MQLSKHVNVMTIFTRYIPPVPEVFEYKFGMDVTYPQHISSPEKHLKSTEVSPNITSEVLFWYSALTFIMRKKPRITASLYLICSFVLPLNKNEI